jgi:soluble lytic murein transglycosylase-like protein
MMKKLTQYIKSFLTYLILLCTVSMPALGSEIYSYIDADGVINYTNKAPSHRATIKIHPQEADWSHQSRRVYKFVDSKGVIHLTNVKPKNSRYKVIYLGGLSVPSFTVPVKTDLSARFVKKYNDYNPLVQDVANLTYLEPELLHAVIQVESAYNPKAVSPKGAVGLMQLMPATAKRFGVTDRTDPFDNVYGGARYLSHLLDLFDYNTRLALASYNAGENAVKRYGNKIPPYRETKNYVKKVMKLYLALRQKM